MTFLMTPFLSEVSHCDSLPEERWVIVTPFEPCESSWLSLCRSVSVTPLVRKVSLCDHLSEQSKSLWPSWWRWVIVTPFSDTCPHAGDHLSWVVTLIITALMAAVWMSVCKNVGMCSDRSFEQRKISLTDPPPNPPSLPRVEFSEVQLFFFNSSL